MELSAYPPDMTADDILAALQAIALRWSTITVGNIDPLEMAQYQELSHQLKARFGVEVPSVCPQRPEA